MNRSLLTEAALLFAASGPAVHWTGNPWWYLMAAPLVLIVLYHLVKR
jgi:hypothetical protein